MYAAVGEGVRTPGQMATAPEPYVYTATSVLIMGVGDSILAKPCENKRRILNIVGNRRRIGGRRSRRTAATAEKMGPTNRALWGFRLGWMGRAPLQGLQADAICDALQFHKEFSVFVLQKLRTEPNE